MNGLDESITLPLRSPGRLGELERELAEARVAIKTLTRQLRKADERHAEVEQAYAKTVANLVQTTQENMVLRHECERLRHRVAHHEAHPPSSASVAFGNLHLSPAEVAAVRKAMARLHHPDVGGDVTRMQAWNVALDGLLEH